METMDTENLKLVNADSDLPECYELVEVEEKTKLLESESGELIHSLVLRAIADGTIRFARKVEVDKERGENVAEKQKEEATLGDFKAAMEGFKAPLTPKEDSENMEEESVNFVSKVVEGFYVEYPMMGSYTKIDQIVKGCPVFKYADNEDVDLKDKYLFVGPDGCWRVGPDVTSCSHSVLKHPKMNAKLPPSNGWLFIDNNDEWIAADWLCVSVNWKDEKGKEETVTFVNKNDISYSPTEDWAHTFKRLGSYIKTNQTMRGCPVFEQVNKEEDEEQHFLFVGPDEMVPYDLWRVGPDVTSFSGSVFKHPQKNAKKPPKTGWLYYLNDIDKGGGFNDNWREDASLQLITNKEVTGVSIRTILDQEFETEEGDHTNELKNIKCLGNAILKGEIADVETILGRGCDVNYSITVENFSEGFTPLIMACRWPSRWSGIEIASLLVGHQGINLDKRNEEGETALAWAVRKRRNLALVKILVEAGAKIYLRDGRCYSPLHRAVEAGALEIVKYLHSKGASINTHGKGQTTPLWTAVNKENLPMVRYLTENGSNLNVSVSFSGYSPFHWAIYKGNTDIVKYMIELGADITAEGSGRYLGNTCLEIAQKQMEKGDTHCLDKSKYGEIIDILKAAEAEFKHNEVVKTCDCSNDEELKVSEDVEFKNLSCLGIAVLENDIKAVEISLAKGCNINFNKTKHNGIERGWTPLMLACDQSSLPIVSLLVKQPGIEINKTNESDEENALHRAVRRDNNLEMVKLLVDAGADPDMRCKYGFSHLHIAAYCEQLEVIKYLQSKGANINNYDHGLTTPLWLAAKDGNLEILKYCASQGGNLDTPRAWVGYSTYTPLNVAVENAHVDIVKFLIEQGADVDKKSFVPSDGGSRSNFEIARSEMKKINENYPLYIEIIRLLKEAGAKVPYDAEVIKKLVLDTLDAVMWNRAEKIGVVKAPSFHDWPIPHSINKLKVITDDPDGWLTMIRALLEVVPIEHPLGAITIALLIERIPYWQRSHYANIDTYLKVLEIASSFEANDSRHGNMSIILSAIARYIKRFDYENEMGQLLLTPAMLDYLFGNLKPGSKPEAAIFSLLALEFLADEKKKCENPNAEIVKNLFHEYGPDDHPLLRLEKLVDSDNLVERQAGFCAQWYLDNLWTIDNQDERGGRKIDKTNVNAKLITSEESTYLKVGPSGLEVRADGPWFETVMSTMQVDVGCWYYEVTIITRGFMQIGWATKHSRFLVKKGYGVGDDKFSQSYDGCRQVTWYNRLQPNGDNPHGWAPEGEGHVKSWKAGDVVGSLIDIENQEIVFSLNGVNVRSEPYKDVFEKVKDGFFAAVSLMSFQQCQINFGRDPFKYPPEERIWKPFNEGTTQVDIDLDNLSEVNYGDWCNNPFETWSESD